MGNILMMVFGTIEINDFLKSQGAEEGICHLFLTHTTAALTTADLDPGTDLDMLDGPRERQIVVSTL